MRAERNLRHSGLGFVIGSARKSATRPSRPGSATSSPVKLKAGKVRLYAPTRFVRDWVSRHYGDRVLAYWQAVNPEVTSVEVNLVPPPAPRRANEIIAMPPVPAPQNYQPPMPRMGPAIGRGGEDAFQGPEARHTFANFVVGKPNEFAYAAARNIAEQDHAAARAQPALYFRRRGPRQDALDARHLARHPRARSQDARAVPHGRKLRESLHPRPCAPRTPASSRSCSGNVDVLMVDDVQFICGKEASQDEFFFTFTSLVEQNKQIVLSSEKPPSELQDIEERMRSRLGSWSRRGHPFLDHTSCVCRSCRPRPSMHGCPCRSNVLEFLAHKISTNIRELEGALNRVVAHGQLIGREITVEMAQDVLHDLLRQADRKVTVDEIQQRVAAHYNIKLAEMSSPRRARSVARPRQVAMYLAKQLTTLQLCRRSASASEIATTRPSCTPCARSRNSRFPICRLQKTSSCSSASCRAEPTPRPRRRTGPWRAPFCVVSSRRLERPT